MKLRPYQREAIDALYTFWQEHRGDNPLIVAPTASGKSLLIAQIISDAMSYWGTRVLVLSHVRELLVQNAKELLQHYPNADYGFYSAGLKQKILNRPITFAGIQSVYRRAFDMVPPPDLVIIDEVHLVPRNTTTRYGNFIADLKLCNPDVKFVGLSATHYRLDSGYLHKGEGAIFDGIAYEISIATLMEQGYLAPVISKGGLRQINLSKVRKRGGEFNEHDLAVAASDPELVRLTVEEIVKLSSDRKAWLVFASGINHAEMMREQFELHNIDCDLVTAETPDAERDAIIERFKAGSLRCLLNVGVLTTGFNAPNIDMIALVRATASCGLYVQMVGRGTRIFPGKPNCLVLDFGANVMRHGFIDAVNPVKEGGAREGDAPVRVCPDCQTINPISARTCIFCGHEFPPPSFNHDTKAYAGAMLSSQAKPEWVDVRKVSYMRWSKADKPDSLRVTYHCGLTTVHEWLCPEHGGYATEKYHARRKLLHASASTTLDALRESKYWAKPSRIQIKRNGKYFEITRLDYFRAGVAEAARRDQ